MPACRIGLGTVRMAGFVETLEASNSMLLIKLRTLDKMRNAIEVFQLANVGSALGAGGLTCPVPLIEPQR